MRSSIFCLGIEPVLASTLPEKWTYRPIKLDASRLDLESTLPMNSTSDLPITVDGSRLALASTLPMNSMSDLPITVDASNLTADSSVLMSFCDQVVGNVYKIAISFIDWSDPFPDRLSWDCYFAAEQEAFFACSCRDSADSATKLCKVGSNAHASDRLVAIRESKKQSAGHSVPNSEF